MKVFLYPIYAETPHLETELEIISNHLVEGDEIVIMQCHEDITTCFLNPYHSKSLCSLCQHRINKGLKLFKSNKIKLVSYPKITLDYTIIPEVFSNIEELKRFQINEISIGLAAASSLISRINRDHKLNTFEFSEEIRKELCMSYYLSQIFENYVIPVIKPDLVYIFNGRISTTAPVVDVCKKHNISFRTHERGGSLNRYWIVENTIPHDVDYVSEEIENLWNKNSSNNQELGMKFFNDRRNRVVQSWYSFTAEQKRDLIPSGFDKEKVNIAIYNSTIEEFAAVKGWQQPLFLFKDEIDALKSILTNFKNDQTKHFYLRVHPNLKGYNNSQTRELYSLENKFSNLTILRPESSVDSYALLENSNLVITFGSTMGVEATYWNKPSIQLGMAYYNKLNCVYIPESIEEMFSYINHPPNPKPKENTYKYGFWELNRGNLFSKFEASGVRTGRYNGIDLSKKNLKYYLYRLIEKTKEKLK